MDLTFYNGLSKILSSFATLHIIFPVFLVCYVSRLRLRASEAFVILLFSVLFAEFLDLILDAWITAEHDLYLPHRAMILATVFYGWLAFFASPLWMQMLFALLWGGIVWGLWYQGMSGVALTVSASVAAFLLYAFRITITHRWLRGRVYIAGLALAGIGFSLVALVISIGNMPQEAWMAMYMLLGFSLAWLMVRNTIGGLTFHLKERLGIISLSLLGVVAIKAFSDYLIAPFFAQAIAQAVWVISGTLPVIMVWQFPRLKP